MQFAIDSEGKRVQATPRAEASCPSCGGDVTAKCGEIVIWHWAHQAMIDCDPWSEPVSAWHMYWQEAVPASRREVVIGNHRADVVLDSGSILEIQKSSISPAEIAEREAFYKRGLWLFDAREAWAEERLYLLRNKSTHWTYRWKHPRSSIRHCQWRRFVDVGEFILRIRTMHTTDGRTCGACDRFDREASRNWVAGAADRIAKPIVRACDKCGADTGHAGFRFGRACVTAAIAG